MDFKQELTNVLQTYVNEQIVLVVPPSSEFGNFSLACFKLSKKADELKKEIKLPSFIEKIEVKGPYLNFYLKKDVVARSTIQEIIKKKEKYGSNQSGKGKKALIEHTSLNPNSSPHMGRARNALIADGLVRLFRFEGYKVDVHYFVNDIGKQIAMLVLACKGKKPSFEKLLELYVEFNAKLKEKPELEKEVFDLLNRLEKGDLKVRNQFRGIVGICIKGQAKILGELDIHFNHFDYESEYVFDKKSVPALIKKLESTKRLSKDEEGRLTLNLEGFNLPMEHPILPLTRADGTSLYILRDLLYNLDKSRWAKGRNLLVLGEDQKLYFQQVKVILSLLGVEAPEVVHYSYMLIRSSQGVIGKMATREGNLVLLEDFMKEATQKASEEIKKRHDRSDEKLAKVIAYAALKFGILKVSADKNIIFDLESALSFEGESGPYVQYSYARANSILEKAKDISRKADYSLLTAQAEFNLIIKLSQFPDLINQAVKHMHPHLLAVYALDVARSFNEFYHSCPVLIEDEWLSAARLDLVQASMQVIKNSLFLLGIEVPDQM